MIRIGNWNVKPVGVMRTVGLRVWVHCTRNEKM